MEEEPVRQCGLPIVSLAPRVHSILPFWSLPSRLPAILTVLPHVGLCHLSFFLKGRLCISCLLCNLRSPMESHKVLSWKLVLFFFCCRDKRNTFYRSLHLEAKVFMFFKIPVSRYIQLSQVVECLFWPLHINDLTWKYMIVWRWLESSQSTLQNSVV